MNESAPPEAPTGVCIVTPDGTEIACTVRYEGTSIADDGELMHDWVATPTRRFSVRPGQQLRLNMGGLPPRTSVSFEMRRHT